MSLADRVDRVRVSGAWREGDPPGDRQFVDLGPHVLESGDSLASVRVAYETFGTHRGDNAVLALHALTGDSHITGPAKPGHPSPGWWDAVVGPGRAIDTDRWFIVAPNILGGCQGTTGPSSQAEDGVPHGSRFPDVSVRDQVGVEAALADVLGIDRWACVLGGSAGGMRALEWAVTHPDRVERLFLLASSAQASAEQIALSSAQQAAIRADAHFAGGDYYAAERGPVAGLAVARQIAHIAYRSEPELAERFGRRVQDDGRFEVASYLEHHGSKLVQRFDANSYLTLTRAMDSHDIARGRGSVEDALAAVTARTVVAAVDSDRLYPPYQQRQLADHIGGCAGLEVVRSMHGHDGFLVESEQVGALARDLLDT